MNLNGMNKTTSSYTSYETVNKKSNVTKSQKEDNKVAENSKSDVNSQEGVVYEPSSETTVSDYSTRNSSLISKLKADSEARMAQMRSLVQKMFEKQGIAIASSDDIWKILASGNFKADPETVEQAKKDISEDGYWGVKQTSERIFSFALALSGGDEEKMKQMKESVIKGFKEATKSWGRELPSITNDTYDAIMKKFDDFFQKETS